MVESTSSRDESAPDEAHPFGGEVASSINKSNIRRIAPINLYHCYSMYSISIIHDLAYSFNTRGVLCINSMIYIICIVSMQVFIIGIKVYYVFFFIILWQFITVNVLTVVLTKCNVLFRLKMARWSGVQVVAHAPIYCLDPGFEDFKHAISTCEDFKWSVKGCGGL